jgi:hypothetical protein
MTISFKDSVMNKKISALLLASALLIPSGAVFSDNHSDIHSYNHNNSTTAAVSEIIGLPFRLAFGVVGGVIGAVSGIYEGVAHTWCAPRETESITGNTAEEKTTEASTVTPIGCPDADPLNTAVKFEKIVPEKVKAGAIKGFDWLE